MRRIVIVGSVIVGGALASLALFLTRSGTEAAAQEQAPLRIVDKAGYTYLLRLRDEEFKATCWIVLDARDNKYVSAPNCHPDVVTFKQP